MSRLIDADALKATITVDGYEHFSGCLSSSEVSLLEMVTDDIDEAPTIDAVPVVRCRECKHLNVVNRKELYAHCTKTNTVFLPFELDTREHFCSLGERKEGTV